MNSLLGKYKILKLVLEKGESISTYIITEDFYSMCEIFIF